MRYHIILKRILYILPHSTWRFFSLAFKEIWCIVYSFLFPKYLNERTPYQFEWVYHQPYGARQRSRIILSDIRVMGDERGTSFSPSKCERGNLLCWYVFFSFLFFHKKYNFCCNKILILFQFLGQANNCELCDVGHYADQPGMGECSLCPGSTAVLFLFFFPLKIDPFCRGNFYQSVWDP